MIVLPFLFPRFPDPSLTVDNVKDFLEQMKGLSLDEAGCYLDIPHSALSVCEDLPTLAQCYVMESPWPSWNHFHDGVQKMGYTKLAEEVKKKYILPGMFVARKI